MVSDKGLSFFSYGPYGYYILGLLLFPGLSLAEPANQPCDSLFCYSSQNQNLQFETAMRLQFDRGVFDNDGETDFQNAWNIRRARLSSGAQIGQYLSIDFTYDFARDDRSAIRNAFVRYTGSNNSRFTVGHFKEPFGMERLTSVQDLAFMERSLASQLTPPRSFGMEFHKHTSHWTAAAGLFTTGTESSGNDTKFGTSARITFAPKSDAGSILHFGLGIAHRNTDGQQEIRFRQRPETRNTDIRLIDTQTFIADSYTYIGIESAIARGPWALQAEYIYSHIGKARISKIEPGNTIHFSGWHIDLTWIVSGESQPYNHEKGTFGRLRPAHSIQHGGWGAWRLGVRLSDLDLTDHPITGGHQRNFTIGINWLLNQNISISNEYVKVLKVDGGEFANVSPAIFQSRLQIIY